MEHFVLRYIWGAGKREGSVDEKNGRGDSWVRGAR